MLSKRLVDKSLRKFGWTKNDITKLIDYFIQKTDGKIAHVFLFSKETGHVSCLRNVHVSDTDYISLYMVGWVENVQ